ncbi:GroES-like protein [Fomitiporia mediterranea MF3/22]|uniref:GroES-like protein n=1 Tax=Fomitiporia mediterranea (strain MF3/22) TaxID=694068 RepID=UPI00044083BD|nr:GroES-like protein [Fomitiporia mediterranea MF3/22]EJC99051.1 GroES-like protein [Fomitiporia mediterranea MF3/22]
MQAAIHVPNSPTLKIVNDFEIPKPGPKQVLLKVQASGVCHSDRYSVLSLGGCVRCLARQAGIKLTPSEPAEQEFLSLPFFGLGANGGHAEFAVADEHALVPVPDNVLPEHAAVMADAGITAWHAIKKTANIKKGERVLITGIGGLGLLAVQFAVFLGADVFAVDMRLSSRELALKFGARQAFDLVELDTALAKGFQVDCAVDFVSSDTTFRVYRPPELTIVQK